MQDIANAGEMRLSAKGYVSGQAQAFQREEPRTHAESR